MVPNYIILARHGETEADQDPTVYGRVPDHAIRLTPRGHLQAQEAGRQLLQTTGTRRIAFYVSPYTRTRQTFERIAEALGDRIWRVREDPRLREQEWGNLYTVAHVQTVVRERIDFGPFYYRIPNGESGADVYDRLSTFFESLHRDFQKTDYPPVAAIITHGMLIRLFLMRWYRWRVEEFHRLRNPGFCQLVVMKRDEQGDFVLAAPLAERTSK
jgi:broad specificity phosphatase PhoE